MADSLPYVYATDQPVIIMGTSDAAGQLKSVVHTRASLACFGTACSSFFSNHGADVEERLNAGEELGEKRLVLGPMSGAYGLILLCHLMGGKQIVMVDNQHPSSWAIMLDKHRIQDVVLLGAAMRQMLHELPKHSFDFVRRVAHEGSCVAPPVFQETNMADVANLQETMIGELLKDVICSGSRVAAMLLQQSMRQFPNAKSTQIDSTTEPDLLFYLCPEDHERHSSDKKMASSAGKLMANVCTEDADTVLHDSVSTPCTVPSDSSDAEVATA
jgi:acyl-CoA synthetase (AMP-forming)/AMP-acid ligase II